MPIAWILLAVIINANGWVMVNMSVLACKINTNYFSIYPWFYWKHKHKINTKPFTGKQFPENCKEKIRMLIVKGISKTRNVCKKKHRVAVEEGGSRLHSPLRHVSLFTISSSVFISLSIILLIHLLIHYIYTPITLMAAI